MFPRVRWPACVTPCARCWPKPKVVPPRADWRWQARAELETRDDTERRRLIRFSNREVLIALRFAALVNLAVVAIAATVAIVLLNGVLLLYGAT